MIQYERQTEPTPDSTRVQLSLLGKAGVYKERLNAPTPSGQFESLLNETGVAGFEPAI